MFQLFVAGATTGHIPEWVGVLLSAEDWGCAPWDIMPGYASHRWWLIQWNMVKRERARAANRKRS